MDLKHLENQEQADSSDTTHQAQSVNESTPSSFLETRVLRSSARVKAQQQREKDTTGEAQQQVSFQTTSSASTSRVTRSSASNSKKRHRSPSVGKGKAKEDLEERPLKRTSRATASSAYTATYEPTQDLKGKKRAAPEDNFDDEQSTKQPTSKRQARTPYLLRNREHTAPMPKKSKSSTIKGKTAMRGKSTTGSTSHLHPEDDIDMMNIEHGSEVEDGGLEDHVDNNCSDDDIHNDENHVEEHHDDEDDDSDPADEGLPSIADPQSSSGVGNGGLPTSAEETAAMAIFGDYRQFGSYMSGLSARLKSMLNNIKPSADPTIRLMTLQELSELLSFSTEDTLAGSFPVEQFVRELVRILGGRGIDDDDDGDDDDTEQDDDKALASALAMSAGGAFQGDENLEAQVLACRCLANLIEALPGVAHTVVYHGAIPALCSKLIEISYIDLAEQTLSTLEKISEEFPSSIVRQGGLAALLNYLDFFSIAVQRTALQAASNCCRNLSVDHFSMIQAVWPIIRNCLSYSDQRLLEYACLCVIRVVESFHRSSVDSLESLVDVQLIQAINQLLIPSGGSPLIASNTYTLLLRALANSARASPKVTLVMLKADMVDTLYQILTGVLPPREVSQEQGDAGLGQGLGGGVADMTVMENLAHRPKDQVEEALSLVSELMPPLPKDGVFDHKGYTDKALSRMVKAKAKAERAAARQVAHAELAAAMLVAPLTPPAGRTSSPLQAPEIPAPESEDTPITSTSNIQAKLPDRTELLRSEPIVVTRFMQLMVPILIDVYAATVVTPVRTKSLNGLLKAFSFLDSAGLEQVLTSVPVASFASSILSSKDHPSLVIGALQLVDLLLVKVPGLYKPSFKREGVFHEIEAFAIREVATSKSKDKDSSVTPTPDAVLPLPIPTAVMPGLKRLSSLSLDPEDAITLRARVMKFKHLSNQNQDEGDADFVVLQRLAERIARANNSENELKETLRDIAHLFSSTRTSVSSFELMQSGIVDSLLYLCTDEHHPVSINTRRELFFEAFTESFAKPRGLSALSTFVKKLQESLTRMEPFDVVTVTPGNEDSKRSSPSLLARQLRLRLVSADNSDIPPHLNNIVVSIHAIATFQALHDYLRPRVSGLMSGNSRLSSMLAALTGAGFGSSSRAPFENPSVPPKPLGPTPSNDTGSISSAPAASPGRRRSLRLSAKKPGEPSETTESSSSNAAVPESAGKVQSSRTEGETAVGLSAAVAKPELVPSDNFVESEFAAEFTDDELDADVLDDEEGAADNSISEKTITVSVEDGSRVIAKTPDGTRVATPSAGTTQKLGVSSTMSYAAALKAKPTDWHLEFSMDDQPLPLDLTIYGAIHQSETRKKSGALSTNLLWQGIYNITYKKVSGPESPVEGRDGTEKSRSTSPTLSSLPQDAAHTKTLRLLRVLHKLNAVQYERPSHHMRLEVLPESAFVNNKLTAKLTRQLEEPMIVASSCLPDWALDLPLHFPFLFPFPTRYNFLQSTSFGYARLIQKWQSQQARNQDSSRRDEGIGFLGRLQRQKVRISRQHILESAVKVFELYGSSSSILEVEYFEEVGTGLGPTLEFYSLVSKEFARKDLKIWRDADSGQSIPYVHHPLGLYPSPIGPSDVASDGGLKRTHLLRVIGQFVAKAMLDSRIVDMTFNKVFLKHVLEEDVPATLDTLKLVDPELAESLEKLQLMAKQGSQTPSNAAIIENLVLDFTIPGYDIELRPGGKDIAVTVDNVSEYITEVVDSIVGKGALPQAKAFREGFSRVFPVSDLQAFSAEELVMLFGNAEEDWSTDTLSEALKADHGFSMESRAIRDLVGIMARFDSTQRRDYLQFITGSPKLPIGGFRGLNPPLTVVRKPHEAPLTADNYLPSVMTCVNYLKLPEYSSKDVMLDKLRIAMQEGGGSFHLS